MKNPNPQNFIRVKMDQFTFECLEGSRYSKFQHDNDVIEYQIIIPVEEFSVRLTLQMIPLALNLSEIIKKKYEVNNEIFRSKLNIKPQIFDEEKGIIFSQYLWVDGTETKKLIQLYGKSFQGIKVLITCLIHQNWGETCKYVIEKFVESLNVETEQ